MLENNDIPLETDKNHVSVGRVGLVYCPMCLKYHNGNCLKKDKNAVDKLTKTYLRKSKSGIKEEDELMEEL